MAKYLWVGKDTTGISFNIGNIDGAEHIDQYCWNISGNWKIWGSCGGSNRWLDSWDYPKPGDQVIVGLDSFTPNNLVQNGWTHAKSPLLWGGYTGNAAAGSWFLNGATGNSWSGTTFTSSLQSFSFQEGVPVQIQQGNGATAQFRPEWEKAYDFPYLGGGLVGDILDWVATRDGLPSDVYTSDYSNTGRNPQESMILKVSGSVSLKTWKDPQGYITGFTLPAAAVNSGNRMIIDLKFVKSFINAGSTAAPNPIVTTTLSYNSHDLLGYTPYSIPHPRTPGLRIRGGAFNTIQLQPERYGFFSPSQTIPYSQIGDFGVELIGVIASNVLLQKRQKMVFRGCTFSSVYVNQYAWNASIDGYPTYNGISYDTQIPVEIASNFNTPWVFQELFGATAAIGASGSNGVLYLTSTPVTFLDNGYAFPPTPRPPSVVTQASSRSSLTQQVILGDRFNNTAISIPEIRVQQPYAGGLHYMPWGLEYAATVNSTNIVNDGGIVYSNEDIGDTSYVSSVQMSLGKYGVMDFTKNQQAFDDWRFGGLSGSSVVGGIVFTDETGIVKGSEGVRLWNTQTRGKGFDMRTGNFVQTNFSSSENTAI